MTLSASSGTATAGADYTIPAAFTGDAAKGQSVATATVTITDDDIDEDNETFTVAASAGTVTATPVTVTIRDDDTADVTVTPTSLTVVKDAEKTYTVVLESQPTAQVTITPTSGTSSVATLEPASVMFSTSNWSTAQTFTVAGAATGTSTISHTATGDTKYASLTVDNVVATVENPPSGTLTVSLTNTTVAENAGGVSITARFDQPVNVATTVTFTARSGTAKVGIDFTVPAAFTAVVGIGGVSASATIRVVDDSLVEGSEVFVVGASGGGLIARGVTVTIQDNDRRDNDRFRPPVFVPPPSGESDPSPDPDTPDNDDTDNEDHDEDNEDNEDNETDVDRGVLLSCDEDPFHDGDWLFGVGDPAGVEEFADLDEVSASHALAVSWLVSEGVLTGTGEGDSRLAPKGSLKRWEMAVWLVRLLDSRDPDPGLADFESFEDIEAGMWWAAHVERLYNLGVTVGCSAEPLRFCPYENVTRAQMASFLVRAFEFTHTASVDFADVGDSSHRRDIETLYWTGVTVGCASDPLRYCPTEPTSRQQMASFVTRALAATEFADLQGLHAFDRF